MTTTFSDTNYSTGLDLKAPNLIYSVHNCYTNVKIENLFNAVVSHPVIPTSNSKL